MQRTLVQWLEELDKHTDKSGGCWIWTGKRNVHGYGVVKWPHLAHRLAWQIAHNGEYPEGYVCHRCDNRRCVNPKHLYLGTAKMNAADAMRRGRHTRPDTPASRRLQAIQRRQVRREAWDEANRIEPDDLSGLSIG